MGGATAGLALLIWACLHVRVGGLVEEPVAIGISQNLEHTQGPYWQYPAGLAGYWQGTLETGGLPSGKRNSSGSDTPAVRQFKVQLVFSAGRRIAPPDTSLPIIHRHAVIWETLSAESTGDNTGRFCEALSFNSRATVGMVGAPVEPSTRGVTYSATLVQTPGVVCGIYNRTGDELVIAWAASEGSEPKFPLDFIPGSGTQVARLNLITPEVFPEELEGQWGGVQLLTQGSEGNSTMVQSEQPVNFTCSAGRCIFRGPAVPHSGRNEPSLVVTDTIFFQRAGESKGKFCEIVTFSSAAPVALSEGSSFGHLRHGAEVHCNVYKRTGHSLVIAWGSDTSGVAPTSFRPKHGSVVATLDLQSERVALPEIQGRWKGFVREKVGDGAVQATPATLSCALGSCVLAEATGQHSGVRVFSVTSSRSTGLGTGQLCEVLAGGTVEQANSLQLREEAKVEWETSHAIAGDNDTRALIESSGRTERLLRPKWEALGQIRCSIFERRGSVLKLASSIESSESMPDSFQPKVGRVSSATFLLQLPTKDEQIVGFGSGQVAMPTGPYGFGGGAEPTLAVEVSPVSANVGRKDGDGWDDSASMLTYVAAMDDPLESLPPVELPRNLRVAGQVGARPSPDSDVQRPPTLKDWSTETKDDTTDTMASHVNSDDDSGKTVTAKAGSAVTGSVLGNLHQQLGIASKGQLPAARATPQSSAATRGATPAMRAGLTCVAALTLFLLGYS